MTGRWGHASGWAGRSASPPLRYITSNEEKTKLFVDMLLDFNINAAERNQWTEDMLAMDYATEHPITKEMLTFTAPLPDHMAKTWKLLDWKEKDIPADPFASLR